MAPQRIFISATSRDLGSYRRLASLVLRQRGYEVDEQEIFGLTYQQIHEKLAHRIQQCDAVVCLVGFVYGGEPQDRADGQPRRSFAQWEYFLARQHNIPVYRLLADQKAPFDLHEPEADELRELQLAYRNELTRDNDWSPFANYDQLEARVARIRFPWEPPPGDQPRPSNLPFPTLGTLFKGREEFLQDLRRRLTTSDGKAKPLAIVQRQAIHGLGGVGKTRLAVEYAHRYADEYTALLFVLADSPDKLATSLADLCGPLVLNLKEQEAREEAIRTQAALRWLFDHSGWFLIVDNVDTEDAARAVEELVGHLTGGHVLITSRLSHWSAAVEPLELDVLAEDDAIDFLQERTRSRRKAASDDGEVRLLARELDGLALALEQAGAYIDKLKLTFAEYRRRWEQQRQNVLKWHDQRLMKYPRSVAVTWETSFAQLTPSARTLLEVLAYYAPDPIPRSVLVPLEFDPQEATVALKEASIDDVVESLAELQGLSLVKWTSDEAFSIHRLVQEVTRSRVLDSDRTVRILTALVIVNAAIPGDTEDVRTWSVVRPLVPHGELLAARADDVAITEPTARLMNQLGIYHTTLAQHTRAEPLYRRALVIDEASYGLQHPRVAIDLHNLAWLLQDTNRLAEAEPLMRRALAIDEASYGHDDPSVARGLNNLAWLLYGTNRLPEAEPLMRRALAIVEAAYGPEHPNVARGLNNLALLLQATSRLAEAEPLIRRALAIDEAAYGPEHPDVARDLNTLAQLLLATNRLAEAEPLIRRALAIDETSFGREHPHVAIRLNTLAQLLQDTNRLAQAEPLIRRALAIDEASYGPEHPDVAISLNNLAMLLWATNRLAEAEPLSRRMLEIFLKFTRDTGHEHPRLRAAFGNYAALLKALGGTPAEVQAQLHAVARPYGVKLP